jgi:Na+/H+ antiporter NhaC
MRLKKSSLFIMFLLVFSIISVSYLVKAESNETNKSDVIQVNVKKDVWEDVPFTKEFVYVLFGLIIIGLIFSKRISRLFRNKPSGQRNYNMVAIQRTK